MSTKLGDSFVNEQEVNFLTRDSWQNWTPTVDQGGNVARTVNYARYCVIGNTVHIMAELTVTGAGAGGNSIIIGGIPAAIQPTGLTKGIYSTIGTGCIVDQGVAPYYGFLVAASASDWRIADSNTRGIIGNNPNFALANTDVITFRATYERA